MNFRDRGFTLIELVISIAVLAILTGLVLAILNPFAQFQKANDAKRKADLAQVQRALEQYYQDFGMYPKSSGGLIVDFKSGTALSWGSSWQPYINVLPKDPSPSNTYYYCASTNQQAYWIYASLDRGAQDPEACNKGLGCESLLNSSYQNNCPTNGSKVTVCDAGGGTSVICNFGLSSPNVAP